MGQLYTSLITPKMATLPLNDKWTQPNNSDKFGSVWYTKNINFDEMGYAKMSPRTVLIMGDATVTGGDSKFGLPLAIGRTGNGEYEVATGDDANFTAILNANRLTFAEDDGTNNPEMTLDSHGEWYQGLWHGSTATAVLSRPADGSSSATWTSRITGLTSGVRHFLKSFYSRGTICVSNGNEVKQYDDSYVNTVDLNIPSDFEVVGMDVNNYYMGVITRLANDGTYGQNQEARFFVWDGSTDGAPNYGVGSDSCLFVKAYKSSFVVLTRAGELLHFTGGGFETLASFPFFFSDKVSGNSLSTNALGDAPMWVEGDLIYINIPLSVDAYGRKEQNVLINNPSGVWCYDPNVGLYHRSSPSISRAYVNSVNTGDVNTSTGVMTISAGTFGTQTIPATGGIARLTDDSVGGLELNHDYYIIKDSSTTFRLATTKANALTGQNITLTSQPTTRAYFWMYDLVDYGQTLFDNAGAIASTGNHNILYKDLIYGGRFDNTDLTSVDGLCMSVPLLENRSVITSPKIFSQGIKDVDKKIYVKYLPLKDTDSIIVKYRKEDVIGLPVSSASYPANWTSPREFYTSQDLSEAKTYLDNGGKLEVEITSGVGAGEHVQITLIEGSGPYNLTLAADVLGVSSGLKSNYTIFNWEVLKVITSDIVEDFAEVVVGKISKFGMFQLELRGSDITIEEAKFINSVSQPD